jgi:flagellar hook protein FlgE
MAIRSRNIANVNTPGYKAMDVVNSGGKTVGRPSAPAGGSVVAETPSSSSQAPNNVDLTKDLVGLKTDELSAGYNLKAIKAQDRMAGTLLDLVG